MLDSLLGCWLVSAAHGAPGLTGRLLFCLFLRFPTREKDKYIHVL